MGIRFFSKCMKILDRKGSKISPKIVSECAVNGSFSCETMTYDAARIQLDVLGEKIEINFLTFIL